MENLFLFVIEVQSLAKIWANFVNIGNIDQTLPNYDQLLADDCHISPDFDKFEQFFAYIEILWNFNM